MELISKKQKHFVILMTACINPNGMCYTKIQDVNERLQQYVEAIKWYLGNTTMRIVVVENTNYDMTEVLQEQVKTLRLEYLVFSGNNYDKKRGKGYGEAQIIKYAMDNSKIIAEESNPIVIKVTGRLILRNINRLRKCVPNTVYAAIAGNYQGVMHLDSRVMVFTRYFLENYFFPRIEEIDESKYYIFERVVSWAVIDYVNDGNRFKEVPVPLRIEGKSGTSGEAYALTLKKRCIFIRIIRFTI